jgi:hypothetical protein
MKTLKILTVYLPSPVGHVTYQTRYAPPLDWVTKGQYRLNLIYHLTLNSTAVGEYQ